MQTYLNLCGIGVALLGLIGLVALCVWAFFEAWRLTLRRVGILHDFLLFLRQRNFERDAFEEMIGEIEIAIDEIATIRAEDEPYDRGYANALRRSLAIIKSHE